MATLPSPAMDFPISLETYNQLCAATIQGGFEKELWEIGAEAIRDWLARNAPDSFGMPKPSGFQWKEVFLPSGTVLRTVFQGRNFHCIVDGDQIEFNGASTSPSAFANAVGGTGRNAWKVIWLLLPGAATWQRASTLRQRCPRRRNAKKPRAT